MKPISQINWLKFGREKSDSRHTVKSPFLQGFIVRLIHEITMSLTQTSQKS